MSDSHDIRIRFRLDLSPEFSIGIGKIELLEAVERSGSISQAAREVGMSYRRAWMLIEDMKLGFEQPVIHAAIGGAHGGGASVTEFGKLLIARYRRLDAEIQELAQSSFGGMSTLVKRRSGKSPVNAVSIKRKLAVDGD